MRVRILASWWFLGLAFVVGTSPVSGGVLWTPMSYSDLYNDSDLIVVGKVTHVAHSAHNEGATNCSRIAATTVLKGTAPENGVRLDFPCRNPVLLEGESLPPTSPLDIFFEVGQEGVWFLKKGAGADHYMATHPGRFKPIVLLPKIRKELEKARAVTLPQTGI